MSAFPHTTAALTRLSLAWAGYWSAVRSNMSVRALQFAIRLDARRVVEVSLAGAVAAGFSLHKGGQEFVVFVDGQRVMPPADAPKASPRQVPGASSRDEHD